MGIVRAGSSSIGTVGQSSTPIIDGCLKFDGWKGQYFRRTFSTSGNRRKWTISCWTRVNPSEGLFSNINHMKIPGGDLLRRPFYSSAIIYYRIRDYIDKI